MLTTDLHHMDPIVICRMIGLLGFAIYVTGFYMLCTGRLTSETPRFFLLNLAAASCVLISLVVDFNLSSALIQGSYVAMSLGAVAMRLRAWRANGFLNLERHLATEARSATAQAR